MDADVRWLLDRAQIRELTARYNRCFDDGDPDGFAALFTEDGVMEVAGTFTVSGREALAEMVRHTPYGVVHVTVDATVEVDGDRAVQDVKLLVLARPGPDAAEAPVEADEHRPLPRRARPDTRRMAFHPPHGRPRRRLRRIVTMRTL